MATSSYVLTDGKRGVITYPFHVDSLRFKFPNVSFPEVISEATMAEFNVFPVEDVEYPIYDQMTEKVMEFPPIFVGDKWTQHRVVTSVSEEEQTQRLSDYRRGLSCSSVQGKIELNNMGFLDDADDVIAKSDRNTQIAWAHATTWQRTSLMIERLGDQLGFTAEDLDNLFTSAARIIV